jgi:hypothetical protein
MLHRRISFSSIIMLLRLISLVRLALAIIILAHDVLKLGPQRFDRREFVSDLLTPSV